MGPTEYEAVNMGKHHSTLSCQLSKCLYGFILQNEPIRPKIGKCNQTAMTFIGSDMKFS